MNELIEKRGELNALLEMKEIIQIRADAIAKEIEALESQPAGVTFKTIG